MRILLTGSTGLIGSAVLQSLQSSGHDVIAVVRSADSSAKAEAAGAVAVVGDITDRDWFADQLRGVDGAIHTATDNQGPAMDDAVTDAVVTAFAGTGKPYVHTGGVWVWGSGDDVSEDGPLDPPEITAWRSGPESKVLDSEVKATIIAPAIVYGPRGEGIPQMIGDGPRADDGALTLIGSGEQHWTTVAVDDLADLYVLALERSDGHATFIGASGDNPTVREIGEALVGPDGSVVAGTDTEAEQRLGAMAEALLLDQQASGSAARTELGWEPNGRSLIQVLAAARG